MEVWVSENVFIANFYKTTFLLLVEPNLYIYTHATNSSNYVLQVTTKLPLGKQVYITGVKQLYV